MEIIYWCVGVFWVVGAIAEIAKMNARIYKHSISEPYPGVFIATYVLLFFTWPYWYFYDKAA